MHKQFFCKHQSFNVLLQWYYTLVLKLSKLKTESFVNVSKFKLVQEPRSKIIKYIFPFIHLNKT